MSAFEMIEIENDGECADVPTEEIRRVDNVNDGDNEKWQKLVLYYLARLKGLCDWRNNSRSKTKTKQPNTKTHLKRCSSQELETRIIDNVTHKPVARLSTKQSSLATNDVGCYLAAGYEEGKQQAVKIISRSLKYGVMTGILLKRGNCYRVAPEYLYEGDVGAPIEKKKNIRHRKKECCDLCCMRHKFSVKSVKSNVRKKENKKKNLKKRASKYKLFEQKKSNVSIRGKKRKRTLNHSYAKKKRVNSATSIKAKKGTKRMYDDDNSDESPANYKKNKRTSDTNVNLNESSNSNTSFQTLSRSLTPIDDRNKKRDVKAKRPRPKIQKPINYVPPMKKPRTKSQSKSPSHHTDDDEVKDMENAKNKSHNHINQFRMPRPRRYSDVMSSMSSSSCTICEDERNHQAIKRTRRK